MKLVAIIKFGFLMTLNLFACNPTPKKDSLKIEWKPGINAPQYYPCTSLGGEYSDGKNYCPIATDGIQRQGWGEGGLEMSYGDFVPNELSVTWFSFAEDKFYSGTFALPQDTMRALFNEGVTEPNGFVQDYQNIVLNFYPLGGVALWMQASCDRIVEIGHYQAKEIEYDWNRLWPDMTDTREEFNAFVLSNSPGALEYIAKHGISQEPFKTKYRHRYDYTIEIDSVPRSQTISVLFECFNGEMDYMRGNDLANNYFKTKAVPKYVSILWAKDSVVYFAKYYTEEEEIFDVFAQMNNACPGEPYVLKLKPDFGTSKLSASLYSKTKETGIRKTGIIGVSSQQERISELKR